jgi:hypothetical protein
MRSRRLPKLLAVGLIALVATAAWSQWAERGPATHGAGISRAAAHPTTAPDLVLPALVRATVSGAPADSRPGPVAGLFLAALVGLLLLTAGPRWSVPTAALSRQRRTRRRADTLMRGPPRLALHPRRP